MPVTTHMITESYVEKQPCARMCIHCKPHKVELPLSRHDLMAVCVWCSWSSLSGRSVATALRMETPLPRPCFGRDNSLNINFLVLGCIGVLRGLIYRIIIPPLFVCHRLQQPMISEQQSYQSRDVSTSKLHQLCSCVALCAAFIYDLECVC